MFPLAGVVADRSVPAALFHCPLCGTGQKNTDFANVCAHSHVYTPSCLVCRVDRPKVMLVSTLVNIFIVLGLALIKHPNDIW